MRLFLSIAAVSLTLAGCNYAPSTSITTTTVNGADVLHSIITTVTEGETKFECAKSASGHCYYAVFTNECSAAANDARATICTTKLIDQFTLPTGESKALTRLPVDFKYCVNQDAQPITPGCFVGNAEHGAAPIG
jgi:hypothetical protein